jgi:hypothetical protein
MLGGLFAILSFVIELFLFILTIRIIVDFYLLANKSNTTNPLVAFIRGVTNPPSKAMLKLFPKLEWTNPENQVTWDFSPLALLIAGMVFLKVLGIIILSMFHIYY